jgi:signal transduction histidine kinase
MRLWHHSRRSIRLRLAGLLTVLFVLLGGALLGASYALVRSNLTADHSEAFQRGADGVAIPHAREPRADEQRFAAQMQEAQDQFADEALRELTVQYLAILAAMVVLSGALGWLVAGRVLRPMSEITATARRVSKESLHERIALEGPDDELKQLADTFDSMLARLEAGFERERAFVRNASHELRTPLSVIQTEADVTLADEAEDPEALRRAVTVMRQAGQRSERLIDALLALARAERGDHPRTEVDLSEVVRELIDDTDLDALRLELALRPARVLGDRRLLRTMAANLIDNAVRHNTADGWIEIRTDSPGEEARIEISNSGAVVTAEEAASLTEPFRRLGTARTGDGLGLGLSIAASVAQVHGGDLAITPLERGGLRVSIRLPAAPMSRHRSDGDLRPSRTTASDRRRERMSRPSHAPAPE